MNTTPEFLILKKHLKENKQRYTLEREKILKAIENIGDHFDAEELYKKLKNQNKKIALATVYNTLDLLTNCGILNKYRFGSDHYRYEKTINKPNHYHLICLNCGIISEFSSDDLRAIENKISKAKNFVIKNTNFQIFGFCDSCQKGINR